MISPLTPFYMGLHGISGLVVEYIVAIDVTRARFPADAFASCAALRLVCFPASLLQVKQVRNRRLEGEVRGKS